MGLDFRHYRQKMESHLRQVSLRFGHRVDEQAIPSYTHPNRLMAWLFWQRVRVVIRYLEARPLNRVLDFGCGSGVLFPFLVSRATQVFAFDIDPLPAAFTIERLGLRNIVLLDPLRGLESLSPGSIDAVLALDVLEHVDDLQRVGQAFARLLEPDGQIVFSAPTETRLYRWGRRLAGFHQHFHVRNAYDIERVLSASFDVRLLARLYPPATLFRVSSARIRPGATRETTDDSAMPPI